MEGGHWLTESKPLDHFRWTAIHTSWNQWNSFESTDFRNLENFLFTSCLHRVNFCLLCENPRGLSVLLRLRVEGCCWFFFFLFSSSAALLFVAFNCGVWVTWRQQLSTTIEWIICGSGRRSTSQTVCFVRLPVYFMLINNFPFNYYYCAVLRAGWMKDERWTCIKCEWVSQRKFPAVVTNSFMVVNVATGEFID